MIRIDYSHTNYYTLKQSLTTQLNITPDSDVLKIPEKIAAGYYKFIFLPNGLECLITNCKLNQDLYALNKGIQEEFYTLRFVELSVSKNVILKIDEEYLWEGKQDNDSVVLTSSLFDFAFFGSKHTEIRSIDVLISNEWVSKSLGLDLYSNVLKKFLSLKTERYNFLHFDAKYKLLFNEVMEDTGIVKKYSPATENTLMTMVERFLYQLKYKLNFFKERDKTKVRGDEVKRLMEVESYLLKDFSGPPPPISFLSRIAAMSSTSLKNKFKKLYGDSVYEYFQKRRMQKARILLLTRKYSIKEIGTLLGYSNLSNFTIAFKKEFNRLPSQSGMQI